MTDQDFIHMRRQEGQEHGIREHRRRHPVVSLIKRLRPRPR